MAKLFKYLFYTFLTLVLLVVIGIGVLVYTYNPNSLKPVIAQQIKAQTGRDLTIAGNISWRFYPWLGLTIQGINLTNNANFGAGTTFIKLNEADVDIKLMPLLSKNIEFGKVKLDGLQVHLITDAQGHNNWDNLIASQQATNQSTSRNTTDTSKQNSDSKFQLNSLKISSIEILNAVINYDNLKTKQSYNLKNFNFNSKNINLDSEFPINMNFAFNSSNPNLNGQVDLDTDITLNQPAQRIDVTPLVLNALIKGMNFPKEGVNINIKTNAVFINAAKASLNITNLSGKIANLAFNGKVEGIDVLNNPIFNGTLNVDSFNPKQFLNSIGMPAPKFSNQNALTNVSLNSQFILMPKAISFTDLKVVFDQSTLKGQAYVAFSKAAQSKINLNIDKINVSNYLIANSSVAAPTPAATPIRAVTPSQAVAGSAEILPLQTLRQLNLIGNLTIGDLIYNKFQMSHIKLNIAANNGLIQMTNNQAQLYKGLWQSNIAINVQSATPVFQINEAVNDVQIAPLTNAFYSNSKYQITGTGNIKASVTTRGNTSNALTQNLNGTGQYALNNGVINGINLSHQMNTALALVDKQAPPPAPANNQTPFGTLTGTVKIVNGVINNNDLLLLSPAIKVNGKGSANLNTQQVQYQVASAAIQGQVDPRIYTLQEKIGGSIPIKVSGTFASLKVYPDIEAILTNMATSYVKQNTDKVKQAVENQVQKLGSQLQQNIQNGLNNLLR